MSVGVDVALASENGSLHVPARVRVEAGQSAAQFSVLVDAGAAGQSAKLKAGSGDGSVQATFTIAEGGEAALLLNAASYSVDYICSPGSFVTALGAGFTANQTQQAGPGNLPTQLAGFQVKVNDIAAPLYFVSPVQANFQCPVLDPGLSISIAAGNAKPVVQRKMEAASPGIYSLNGSGAGQGAILIAGTMLAATAGSSGRPAKLGEYVEIYANGLGVLDTPWPAGTPAPADKSLRVKNPVLVVLGGIEVEPSFVGLAANSIGLYQVNLQVPFYAPVDNAVPVLLKVFLDDGSVRTSNAVTMAIASAS
jgi:uncharacterized protein (TIGR03437 family)